MAVGRGSGPSSSAPIRVRRVDPVRLAVGAYVVVVAVFVAFRLLAVGPWVMPAFDVWAYWLTRDGLDYASAQHGATGAFVYSPAFSQAIAPLTALPWPTFAGIWTAGVAGLLLWLAGPYALPLALLPPVAMSIALGQLDLAFAAVAIAGLRWPALWAIAVLTKVTPGIGLLWFAARREWRSLGIAVGATLAIAAVSAAIDPGAWGGWLDLLRRSEFPELGDRLWFLPVPLSIRLPIAAAIVVWGARADRRWTLPVAVLLALPVVWVNSPTILVALLPLSRAAARTAAGRWLGSSAPRGRSDASPLAAPTGG
jgi:hypothetical protein